MQTKVSHESARYLFDRLLFFRCCGAKKVFPAVLILGEQLLSFSDNLALAFGVIGSISSWGPVRQDPCSGELLGGSIFNDNLKYEYKVVI